MTNLHAPLLLGIRHHGPGSARALLKALEAYQPDMILVEGPPEANDLLPLMVHEEMEPPVALLIYRPDRPEQCVYYPFAEFSPEWQALCYGQNNGSSVRFFDLPQAYRFGVAKPASPDDVGGPAREPFELLAIASGFGNHESFWNQLVEQRRDSTDLFEGVLELMSAMREGVADDVQDTVYQRVEAQREAYMRQCMRQALAEGYQRIAVVCGAWHAPALQDLTEVEADDAVLGALVGVEVHSTWVPWTYGRIAARGGYGAGIHSPGWYHHLWERNAHNESPSEAGIHWLVKVAQLLRDEGIDTPPSHVIDSVRLADSLAAMRNSAFPGLDEFNEAIQAVICFGDDAPMALIHKKLIVGERLGSVPEETPRVPLERDLARLQRELSLFPSPETSELSLDLRKANDRARSQLLHRLYLLGVPWGHVDQLQGQHGTYNERWTLQWSPDFVIRLIDASMWGTTVLLAASGMAIDKAEKATDLPTLTRLLNQLILSDLPAATEALLQRLSNLAALKSDVVHMMEALLPLIRTLRYGSVRQVNEGLIKAVVAGLITRICIGLPLSASSLNDEAADKVCQHVASVNDVLRMLKNEQHLADWQAALLKILEHDKTHPQLHGRLCRLMLNDGVLPSEDVARRMRLALAGVGAPPSYAPKEAAGWLTGFLAGSGMLLIHDDIMWQLIDEWVSGLDAEAFMALLAPLRKTFSDFSEAERRQLGERVQYDRPTVTPAANERFDSAQGSVVLPMVGKLLGVEQ